MLGSSPLGSQVRFTEYIMTDDDNADELKQDGDMARLAVFCCLLTK
jgi:hypothetical protein